MIKGFSFKANVSITFFQEEQEENMRDLIERGLKRIEEKGEIQFFQSVSGGDINEAFYVRSGESEYFVKLNKQMDVSFFEFEADGLNIIRNTRTIDVPAVYGVVVDEDSKIPMLWLEWVEGRKSSDTEVVLGERLAALHLCEGAGYGWEGKSFIGKLPQENQILASWLSYYREFRLGGQLKIGQSLGRISGERNKRLMRLMERLDEWIPDKPKASTLHGDLWGGNWITGKNGLPYLIDPSILYGDHEFEIAFTELFGGFSDRFYDSYNSVFPLSPEFEIRKELYQLYYLLVHLNMFGEAYGGAVDRILKKYVG
jgi:fructosamine-3-kinase